MVVLATGHPLKKHSAELLPEDAVDYEVHRTAKRKSRLYEVRRAAKEKENEKVDYMKFTELPKKTYKFYRVAKKKEKEILKCTELPEKENEKSKL